MEPSIEQFKQAHLKFRKKWAKKNRLGKAITRLYLAGFNAGWEARERAEAGNY